MAVAVTQLAGEAIVGAAVPPGLVVVEGKASLAVVSRCVVYALADGVDVGVTATGVAVTSTSERGRMEEGGTEGGEVELCMS